MQASTLAACSHVDVRMFSHGTSGDLAYRQSSLNSLQRDCGAVLYLHDGWQSELHVV